NLTIRVSQRQHCRNIEPAWVVEGSGSVSDGNHWGPGLVQEPSGTAAHGANSLDCDSSVGQLAAELVFGAQPYLANALSGAPFTKRSPTGSLRGHHVENPLQGLLGMLRALHGRMVGVVQAK